MSEFAGSGQDPSPSASPAADPLEQLYYLHDGVGVIGPIKGSKLKEMIANGAVGRGSSVNLLGAPDWAPVAQFAPFSGFFKAGDVGPEFSPGRPVAARGAEKLGAEKFASFWIRLGAYIIDYVLTLGLVGLAAVIFAIFAVTILGQEPTEAWLDSHSTALNIVGTVIALSYYAYFSAGPWQATPGKRICGIYVIRTNGKRVDAAFAVFRDFAYIASSLPLFLGFVMVFWTDEHKALHDMICGTRVVYGKL